MEWAAEGEKMLNDLVAEETALNTIYGEWETKKAAMEAKESEWKFDDGTDADAKAALKTAYDTLKGEFDAIETRKTEAAGKITKLKEKKTERETAETTKENAAKEAFDDSFDAAKLAYETAFNANKTKKDNFADMIAAGTQENPAGLALLEELD